VNVPRAKSDAYGDGPEVNGKDRFTGKGVKSHTLYIPHIYFIYIYPSEIIVGVGGL